MTQTSKVAPPPESVVFVGGSHAELDQLIGMRNALGEALDLSGVYVVVPDTKADPSGSLDAAQRLGATVAQGSDWHNQLREKLWDRLDSVPPKRLVCASRAELAAATQVRALLEEFTQANKAETIAHRQRVDALYEPRELTWWRERYACISRGSAARVMVVTSRYSSYMKHAASEFIDSLQAAGHDTELLVEPRYSTHLTSLAGLKRIAAFEPDLVVLINHARNRSDGMIPMNVPFLCWLQDEMAPIYTADVQVGELDFIAGHVYPDSARIQGHSSSTVLEFPVPVSTQVFRTVGTDELIPDRFVCDIAYVSHQSETPEQLHSRIRASLDASSVSALDRCQEELLGIADRWSDSWQEDEIDLACSNLAVALKGDVSMAGALGAMYVHPMIERILRHRMLEWAGNIAERRGLTFKVFGEGWREHPALSRYAQGPLQHDGDLRLCYAGAGTLLHGSSRGLWHQRIAECALSGGLPLCLRNWGEMYRENLNKQKLYTLGNTSPDASVLEYKSPAYVLANHPELQALIDERSKMPAPPQTWDHEQPFFQDVYTWIHADPRFLCSPVPPPPPQCRPWEIIGDTFGLTFSTEAELEERILHALNNRAWRTETSRGIASRSAESISMDAFAASVLDMVSSKLASVEPAAQEVAA